MKYLLINSATTNLVVAIIIDGKIVYMYDKNDGNDTSSKIMPVIDEAFRISSIKPKDLDKIFVCNGPGSFTGIRVGLTVAKTMAWSLNIPCFTFSSLELMASGFDEDTYCLIDARRGYVYVGGYDSKLNETYKDRYVLFENSNLNGKFVSYDTFIFPTVKPELDLLKVIYKHENDEIISPHLINPNYLKLTEAEEKRLNDNGS